MLNLLGVIYRRLLRYPEALATLDRAAKPRPTTPRCSSNRGNVLMDMEDGVRAEAVFAGWSAPSRATPSTSASSAGRCGRARRRRP